MKTRNLLLVLLIVALLFVAATPALAAGGPKPGKGPGAKGNFTLTGTLVSTNSADQSLTVRVVTGNAVVKPFLGKDLTIKITSATRIMVSKQGSHANWDSITALQAGQKLSISGSFADDTWTAKRLTAGASKTSKR